MSHLDNPAGRLLALLQAARKQDQGSAAIRGWEAVFGIEQTDYAQFMRQVSHMINMASETRELVLGFDDADPDIILEHFGQVDTTLKRFQGIAHVNMQQFLTDLDPKSGEHSLKLCSSLLHRRAAEPVVEEDTASWLTAEVEELINELIKATDLDSEVKQWLMQRLNEVRDALLNLRIHGALNLEEATNKITGGLVGKIKRIGAINSSRMRERLVAFIVAVDMAINLGANVKQITSGEPPKQSPIFIFIESQFDVAEIPTLPPALEAAPDN